MDEFVRGGHVRAPRAGRRSATAEAPATRGRGSCAAKGWDGDASAPGGPHGWAPLLYVCHSVFASRRLARELLARGADPNVTFTNEYGEMSALYGAAGVVHDPELTRVLLEAGADPDDGESVYHATEAADPGVPARAARARRDARADPPRARARRRAARARPAAARGRRRRARAAPVRRPPRPRAGVPAAAGRPRRRPRAPRGRGLAPPRRGCAPPTSTRGCATRDDVGARRSPSSARRPRSTPTTSRSPRSPAARTDRWPEQPDYDQQEVLILAALRGQAARVIEHYGPDFAGRRRRLAEGPAAAPRRVVRQRRGSWTSCSRRAPIPPRASGRRWPRRCVRRATRTAITSASPSGSSPPATSIEPWMLEQADGPLAAWLRRHQRGGG